MTYDPDTSLTITGEHGRDAGKAFQIQEVPPIDMAGFVLRLLAALRLSAQADLMELFTPAEDAQASVEAILRVLTGCDPDKMHALIHDALRHVQIAPDPQHPGALRPLQVATDIREMKTLGQILGAFARKNLMQMG